MRYIIFVIVVLVFFANTAFANIVINEVAWMGTVNSANDEWIELYNNGNEDIDLNGWVLKAQDDTPLINLSGIIKTKSFFLLERTDDTTIPDVPADLIYTGALSNTGEILILKNNDTEIDRVDASAGWPAGDNVTKQTMQRKTDGNWITADPTPRAQNSGQQSTSTSDVAVSQTTTVVVWPVEPQIYANAGDDKTAIVGADSKFSGQALGLQKEPLGGARYLWSFGDGSVFEGQNVIHSYQYPGDYIVVLNVSSGQYSASDNLLVKAVPNQLKIIEANEEFVKLQNGSNNNLDISGWFLRLNNQTFKFPASTFIKADSILTIPSSTSGIKIGENEKIELLYSNWSVANKFIKKITSMEPTSDVGSEPQDVKHSVSNNMSNNLEEEIVATATNTSQTANIITASQNNSWSTKKWLISTLFLGVIAGFGLFFIRRQSSI